MKVLHSFLYWICFNHSIRWREATPEFRTILESIASRQNARISFLPTSMSIEYDRAIVYFGYDRIYQIKWELDRDLGFFFRRLVFKTRGNLKVCDLRNCRQFWHARLHNQLVDLTSIPESVDVCEGYFKKFKPRNGDLVFDIGAYCGEVTMVLSSLVGTNGRVIAFEPDAHNAKVLRENIESISAQNVTVEVIGIAGRESRVSASSKSGPSIRLEPNEDAIVPVISLRKAIQMFGKPDYVKMDVEGMEIAIIEDSLRMLAHSDIKFMIASYHICGRGEPSYKRLEALFSSVGYRVETGFPQHLTTWAWPSLSQD